MAQNKLVQSAYRAIVKISTRKIQPRNGLEFAAALQEELGEQLYANLMDVPLGDVIDTLSIGDIIDLMGHTGK